MASAEYYRAEAKRCRELSALALAIAVLVGLLFEAAITFPGFPPPTPDYRPHHIDVRGGLVIDSCAVNVGRPSRCHAGDAAD